MKTSKKISNINKYNRVILILTVLSIAIFIFSILFHITPLGLISIVSEFAIHHYFLSSFLAVVTFSICIRAFFYKNDKIAQLQNEKRIASQLKINRRKALVQKFKNNITLKLFALRNQLQKKAINSSNKYSERDVLTSQEEFQIRQYDLMNAMKLGNSFKQSVKLYYKESNLNKCIESAILFVSNEHVTLKGGHILPIRSIYKVEI